MSDGLGKRLERAKKYLSIVINFTKTRRFAEVDYDWLTKNSRILEDEMRELSFGYIEVGMSDFYGKGFKMKNLIALFPNMIKTRSPVDIQVIITAIQTDLNGYIQKVEEILKDKTPIKKLLKEKRFKIKRIEEFNKAKFIELIFIGLYITSLILLVNETTFIFGYVMNIISVVCILFFSLIKWEK